MNIKITEIDGRRVNLEDANGVGKWLELADHVQSKYLRLGEASVTITDDVVTFVKMLGTKPTFEKTEKSFGGNFNKTLNSPKPEEKKF